MAGSEVGGFPRMIRGSVVVQRRRCGKGSCRCTDGESLHEATVLSYSEGGRNRTVMLRADQVGPVRAAVEAYRAAQAKLETQGSAGLAALLTRAATGRGRWRAGPRCSPLPVRCSGRRASPLFTDLLTGWVLAPGRGTITAMIAVADPACGRAHDAYHRFVRDGAWSMSGLWRLLAVHAVATFAPSGVVSLDCDDTLFHKSGRRVAGAGTFRDAVRSTSHRVVYALGLNLVVVTLRVIPPLG